MNFRAKNPPFRLAKEEELMEFKNKAEELEKENLELATQLAKKEAELDVKTQEKEDVEANLERTKEKLETEVARHNELKHRVSESDVKMPEKSSMISVVNCTPPPPPPPAPPMAPPPPPGPPPPPSSLRSSNNSSGQKSSIKKNVPQSSNPLKSFNWSKLPECKVKFFKKKFIASANFCKYPNS